MKRHSSIKLSIKKALKLLFIFFAVIAFTKVDILAVNLQKVLKNKENASLSRDNNINLLNEQELNSYLVQKGIDLQRSLDREYFKEKQDPTYFLKEYREIAALNNKGFLTSIIGYIGNILALGEDATYALMDPFQAIIKQNNQIILQNPYRNMGASVRVGGGALGNQELMYRDNRFPIVKKAQETFLDMKLENDDVLEIGFSCSGGGWRAMCCTAGSCVGAKKIGFFDTAMYVSALSGSTWFFGPWIYSGMDLYDYKKRLINVAAKGLGFSDPKEMSTLMDNIWIKFTFDQPINVIDFYGAMLANTLLRGLSKDPHTVYISEQRKVIDNGKFPMPVYTAVLGQEGMYEYSFEFTPYEAGTRWLKSYVPTWAFGRKFKAGESKENAPEQYMGFMMGIFGSAFAANFKEIYSIVIDGIGLPDFMSNFAPAKSILEAVKKVLKSIVYDTDAGDIRLTWARVPNYVYKMPDSEYKDYKELKLVDSGVNINNPVFAAYRKPPFGSAPDIIFVFDSGSTPGYKEMKVLVDYAKKFNLKFPQVKEFKVGKQVIHVFKDDNDLKVPVIVYMPMINGFNLLDKKDYAKVDKYYVDFLKGFDLDKANSFENGGFATTYNFKYTKKEAETLMAMTEYNIVTVQNEIKKLMKERIELRRKARG